MKTYKWISKPGSNDTMKRNFCVAEYVLALAYVIMIG